MTEDAPTKALRTRPRFFPKTCAVLFFWAGVLSVALPVEPPPSTPFLAVDLQSYLEYAQQHNPDIQAFESRYQAAMQRIPQVKSLPDPKLQVTHFVESVQTRTGPQEQVIGLSQTFPWFGKLGTQKQAASAEAEALWFAYQNKELILAKEVALAFYEYGYLNRALFFTEENLQLLRKLEPIVTEKVKSGGELNTLLRLQVEIGKVEDHFRSLEKTRINQSAKLKAYLNAPNHKVFPWPVWDPPAPVILDQGFLISALERNHPELKMLDRQIESREAHSELAKLQNYPDFTFGMNYLVTGDAANPATPGSGEDPWSVTFAVNLPIWLEKYEGARKEALYSKEAIQKMRDERENTLKAELTIALADLDDANRRLQLYGKDLLAKAKQAVEVSETSYQSGKTGILEVIDSQRSLLSLQVLYWRAAADAWQNHIRVLTLTNQPLR